MIVSVTRDDLRGLSLQWPTKHLPYRRFPLVPACRARKITRRSAKPSWRPRGAAGFSANTPGAIEESLAAQRQPAPESGLAEALTAISRALEEARAAASGALDSLALQENLAPVRKGVRVIREIAWRLREIGADGRICDLIDSQISVIQAGCGQISSAGPRAALSAAFDLIEERIEAFGGSDTIAPQAAAEAMASPSPVEDTDVAASMPAEAVGVTPEVVAVRDEVAEVSVEMADMPAAALDVTLEVGDENPGAGPVRYRCYFRYRHRRNSRQ